MTELLTCWRLAISTAATQNPLHTKWALDGDGRERRLVIESSNALIAFKVLSKPISYSKYKEHAEKEHLEEHISTPSPKGTTDQHKEEQPITATIKQDNHFTIAPSFRPSTTYNHTGSQQTTTFQTQAVTLQSVIKGKKVYIWSFSPKSCWLKQMSDSLYASVHPNLI